ncbi:MAG: Na(+)/H(+) antiporter subunit D1 [Candidatus Moanabacter tarae]|uniref:Na(+)/H(+) antiporter subunit D1 n=1 Tax=Candidatus Moanibacter tarae TaxID=2200854 RepID=A0A2Z4AQZ4_9BACT|nr:MAG: Na(+)/H(+) antiporter subunit D1 [Candidatus Moanabacter tarae]|tara:strand:- start:713 stop:2212 length:1500 start_codon:yes stop_codon:yes gene_type:complete
MSEQYPAITLLFPFFSALLISLFGGWRKKFCLPIVVASLAISTGAGLAVLWNVVQQGEIIYLLGNWPRPYGIEFRIDSINILLVLVILVVALMAALYSKESVERENSDKLPSFYILYLLLVTGLMGMCLTGDAFNLYVLMEVSSLTSYALIAMGRKQAPFSSFNYLIMGTIGASFYLIGVGYLFIKTGSLNMVDIQQIIEARGLYGSITIMISFIFIMIGVWIKMAFFPLHGWLPNAYYFAPSAAGCLIAPLMTKVGVYVMIRMMFTVFGAQYIIVHLGWTEVVVFMAVIAISAGSILAFIQANIRRMLTYLIVAEIGYIVGGVWMMNEAGFVGAVYHVVSDAFMTLCLFLGAAVIGSRLRNLEIRQLSGLYRTMPITMGAITVGGLSMIGIPPTCGFFSKWYLIRGGIESGQWVYVGALLLSSLLIAVLFFRIIETAFFHKIESEHLRVEKRAVIIDEVPPLMLVPLVLSALIIIAVGLLNQPITLFIGETAKQFGLN